MSKKAYIEPKAELFKITQSLSNLLVTFSISGNIEDYEGSEDEDF